MLNFNDFVNESFFGGDLIQENIKKINDKYALYTSSKYYVIYEPNKKFILYLDNNKEDKLFDLFDDTICAIADYKYNNEYNTHEIKSIISNKKGFGSILYLALINDKGSLIPNREKLTTSAIKAWDNFLNGKNKSYVKTSKLNDFLDLSVTNTKFENAKPINLEKAKKRNQIVMDNVKNANILPVLFDDYLMISMTKTYM